MLRRRDVDKKKKWNAGWVTNKIVCQSRGQCLWNENIVSAHRTGNSHVGVTLIAIIGLLRKRDVDKNRKWNAGWPTKKKYVKVEGNAYEMKTLSVLTEVGTSMLVLL